MENEQQQFELEDKALALKLKMRNKSKKPNLIVKPKKYALIPVEQLGDAYDDDLTSLGDDFDDSSNGIIRIFGDFMLFKHNNTDIDDNYDHSYLPYIRDISAALVWGVVGWAVVVISAKLYVKYKRSTK